MSSHEAIAVLQSRLDRCYAGDTCNWQLFYRPRHERANFATRYHLVYPGLAYFIMLKRGLASASTLRPQLDTMFRGLTDPRVWRYWHDELHETTWPLQERNLTYAGRLATFVGFYIDAFGEPPVERIEIGERSATYSELSRSLWDQMEGSPNCGVSCYRHQSMVMCNAHLLINNILHDRLFGTSYAASNQAWIDTVVAHLVCSSGAGPLFYYGTQPNSAAPQQELVSFAADIWGLFLMSSVIPEQVSDWFDRWKPNIRLQGDQAVVPATEAEAVHEFSCEELATAWAYCLARELGRAQEVGLFRSRLHAGMISGFVQDPLISGLCLLGEVLEPGAFRRLVTGK
jgi:linalool dehydratase/isomerase-like protein